MQIIKFYKDGCVPCNSVSTFLSSKNVDVTEVNVFKDPKQAIHYEIMSVPVVLLVDDEGNELKRVNGFKVDALQEIIDQLN